MPKLIMGMSPCILCMQLLDEDTPDISNSYLLKSLGVVYNVVLSLGVVYNVVLSLGVVYNVVLYRIGCNQKMSYLA